ncbi:hypothetical protein CONPUDRAFT_145357 [Coniophora puteana RWD-64-598 SS2]|uniref:Glycosyltransferase family 2 protein n=1 Tax=Coniophora puteana (strain RWD-64-598) TaxID=741705 RepID=A0A5M3MJ83_CONPW|nr:uncharacterized protein CONPUDRAFT_145357 [Coniophora puteana RWD-64-598 SS2]EIW79272.1 hypothetical protein CONPUDRAFT_145357 [Coniophora puteana RWD-64-598 SS2]
MLLACALLILLWSGKRSNAIQGQPQDSFDSNMIFFPLPEPPFSPPTTFDELAFVLDKADLALEHSVVAILPVSPRTVVDLERILSSLVDSEHKLGSISLVFADEIVLDVRQTVSKHISERVECNHAMSVEITLHPCGRCTDTALMVFSALPRLNAEVALVLDEDGLLQTTSYARHYLLNPRLVDLPVGPIGFQTLLGNTTSVIPTDGPISASYLSPPFVMSIHTMRGFYPFGPSLIWHALGSYVAVNRLDMIGGVVIPQVVDNNQHSESLPAVDGPSLIDNDTHVSTAGTFVLVFAKVEDLKAFSTVACGLQNDGHVVRAFIYDESDFYGEHSSLTISETCVLLFYSRSDDLRAFRNWMKSLLGAPDVMIGLSDSDFISATLSQVVQEHPYLDTTLIRLPRADLPYSSWMKALALEDWIRISDWNAPEVTVSVITNDRPASLRRLLNSLNNARYFGDDLLLRINVEQAADDETLRIVDGFEWGYGNVFVHRRVIHGGLLPAVVESWYPRDNNSFGILLEDDTEVSPLFYAWTKMNILHFRLFGVSLYQQKNIELKPEGRVPFNPRRLFKDTGFIDYATPYLSQVPCSWGAVYFPEHWREFHDYLAMRLSEHVLDIHLDVVPDVRSNHWPRSWKKYFIEVAYLRGYVMLYPNYEDFLSLSTNHLEIGSHVKAQPQEAFLKKRELFLLPLMPLPDPCSADPGLLSGLPGQKLPKWNHLPVLDFIGHTTSLEELVRRGLQRRSEIISCPTRNTAPFDIRGYLCLYEVDSESQKQA